jgi:hypothetical protein
MKEGKLIEVMNNAQMPIRQAWKDCSHFQMSVSIASRIA